jgi:hypothetical protein
VTSAERAHRPEGVHHVRSVQLQVPQ